VRRLFVLLLAVIALLPMAAEAETRAVYGRDSNDGRSQSTALKSRYESNIQVRSTLSDLVSSRGGVLRPARKRTSSIPSLVQPTDIIEAEDVVECDRHLDDIWLCLLDDKPLYVKRDDAWLKEGFTKDALEENEWSWDSGLLYVKVISGTELGRIRAVRTTERGWSVTSGDFNGDGLRDIAIGNPVENTTALNAGAVYIYLGNRAFSLLPSLKLRGPHAAPNEHFGFHVSSAGDVNGDGSDELLVSTGWGVDKVYLYWGGPQGPKDSSMTEILPPQGYPAYGFGHGISLRHGDMNGDGYSDFLIGSGGRPAYFSLYYGSPQGAEEAFTVTFPGTGNTLNLSFVGDTNKDGFDDVAVCVAKDPPADSFDIYLYRGSPSGILEDGQWTTSITLPKEEVYRNGTVAPAGDINGDGFADILIGNEWARGAYDMEGKAYIYHGSPTVPSFLPDIVIDNPEPEYNARFGSAVNEAGDFDGDGLNDILIGSPYQFPSGAAYVFFGSKNKRRMNSVKFEEVGNFGWSLSPVGDLKGNGQNYIVAGAEFGTSFLYSFLADLNVQLLQFNVKSVAKGTRLTGLFQVENTGYQDAKAFTVSCSLVGDEADLIMTRKVRTLKAGSSRKFRFSQLVTVPTAGRLFILEVDPGNEIPEIDESQNRSFRYIP
jgi:hypothetical protein